MPISRVTEMPQRQSPRGSHHLRASSSNLEPLHHRPIADRSPKLGDRRSRRGGVQSGVNQKKVGTRIADLESQLGQAHEELKTLKDQLVSTEAARRQAQEELEKTTKKSNMHVSASSNGENLPTGYQESKKTVEIKENETSDDIQQETDVYEVPVEMVQHRVELRRPCHQQEKHAKPAEKSSEGVTLPEKQKLSIEDSALKDDEINLLGAMLKDKEKELNDRLEENDSLKMQLDRANSDISSSQMKEKDIALRVIRLEEDLKASNESVAQLKIKLEGAEEAKEALEAEMKKLRIQTEQWRKAADAAASILSGGMEMKGKFSERCSSMDKHSGSIFELSAGGYNSLLDSPGMTDYSGDGNGKRKGSGIKMFGDIWKKKGQK